MIYSKAKHIENLDFLLLSIWGYNWIYSIGPLILPKMIVNVIGAFWVFIFFVSFFREKKNISLRYVDKDIRTILKVFIVWNLLVVLYSLLTDYSFTLIMHYITQPRSFLIYFTPFLALIKYDDHRIKNVTHWLFFNIVAGLITYGLLKNLINVASLNEIDVDENLGLSVFNYFIIASFPSACFMASAFMFIYGHYNKKWKPILMWIALIVAVVSAFLLGRRSAGSIPLLALFAKILYDLRRKPKTVVLLLVAFVFIYINFSFFEQKFFSDFSILQNRMFDDTRESVTNDYYRDMHGLDYIFGRGSEGLVYSSDWGYRSIIETGYLDMILHGGIIYLFLYIYLLFIPAKRALLSKNKLAKAMALFLFIDIICLYPGGHLEFNLNTTVLWMCVSLCSNRYFRKSLTDIKL
jgi:hypothetical protein